MVSASVFRRPGLGGSDLSEMLLCGVQAPKTNKTRPVGPPNPRAPNASTDWSSRCTTPHDV
eukprot:8082043-Pyramimonas_sp.AAC.1